MNPLDLDALFCRMYSYSYNMRALYRNFSASSAFSKIQIFCFCLYYSNSVQSKQNKLIKHLKSSASLYYVRALCCRLSELFYSMKTFLSRIHVFIKRNKND